MHTSAGFITSPICVLMLAFYCGAIYFAYRLRSHWLGVKMLPRAVFVISLLLVLQLMVLEILDIHLF